MSCITEHPGFQSTCLDVWVLATTYYTFRQQHGADSQRGHEVYLLVLKFSIYTQTIFKNS